MLETQLPETRIVQGCNSIGFQSKGKQYIAPHSSQIFDFCMIDFRPNHILLFTLEAHVCHLTDMCDYMGEKTTGPGLF